MPDLRPHPGEEAGTYPLGAAGAMSKVYVLSSGSYSDWTIEGIFASREEAQAVLDAEKAAVPVDLLPKFRSRTTSSGK